VALIQDYTTNKVAARNAVNALDNFGATALYDGVRVAALHSQTVSGRRALVVMTDGSDTASSASLQQAITAAKNAGVPVFTIGFGSANQSVLQQIANQTGGSFSNGATSADLQTILTRIGQTLNSQYILSWTTSHADGDQHDVTIQVAHEGATESKTTSYNQAGTNCANLVPCVADADTLCLSQERFRVEVEWLDFDGDQGVGSVASCGAEDSGIFYFFNPDNWEMLVKTLDGCANNGHFWVFFAATTNVGYTLTVTDTQTGATKKYTNDLGVSSPAVTDTTAFATCP
jgi:hypothetical protein